MLQNHLTIALRNLAKNRLFSLLNIGGLSAGLAVAMLIGLYVRDECSFDRFHEKADRIFRINLDVRRGGQEQTMVVFQLFISVGLIASVLVVQRQLDFIQNKKLGYENNVHHVEQPSKNRAA